MSKDARISIAIGIMLTLIVLLLVFNQSRSETRIYYRPPEGRKNQNELSRGFGTEKNGRSKYNKESKALESKKQTDVAKDVAKGESRESERKTFDRYVPKHQEEQRMTKKLADTEICTKKKGEEFLSDLRDLKENYETKIYHAPRKRLEKLLETSTLDAEAYLLDAYSPGLHTFYEECAKVMRAYQILDATTPLTRDTSALLFDALNQAPPEPMKTKIREMLTAVYNPYEELFTFVRKHPGTTLEKLPVELHKMLAEAENFEVLVCPTDVEEAVLVLYVEATTKNCLQAKRK